MQSQWIVKEHSYEDKIKKYPDTLRTNLKVFYLEKLCLWSMYFQLFLLSNFRSVF